MTGVLAFLSSGVGTGELLVIFVAVLLLFGPKRLPEIARMIGKAMAELRRASNEFRAQVMAIEDEAPRPPLARVSQNAAPVVPTPADIEVTAVPPSDAGGDTGFSVPPDAVGSDTSTKDVS